MKTVSFTILRLGNSYYFQHRDDKPGIASPGLYSAFGGAIEPSEDPLEAAKRELTEETSLNVDALTFKYLGKIDMIKEGLGIRHAYLATIKDPDFDVYEGQGKVQLSKDEIDNLGPSKFAPSTWEAVKLLS